MESKMYSLSLQSSHVTGSNVTLCDALTRRISIDGDMEPDFSMSPVLEKSRKISPKDYTFIKKLGHGSYGEVYLATTAFGEEVVMKKISKTGKNYKKTYVDREAAVGNVLSENENILCAKSRFETANSDYLMIPYFDGVDLITWMEHRDFEPLDESNAKKIFRQVLNALLYCHRNGVGHRDIKCENILVDKEGNVKVIDFGLCSIDDNKDLVQTEGVGSPQYVAPELFANNNYKSFQADVFSTGVVLFCILFGQFPYNQDERMAALTSGIKYSCPGQMPHSVSSEVEDLLIQMLESDPEKRITMEQIAVHKWLNL